MKGTIVFDFDDTLADTVRFKKTLDASRMREFVFKDADAVLRRLKGEGWELALLTVGDQGWQAWKVGGSGLLPYFDHVLYTAEPKTSRVAAMLAWTPPLVFVNDNGAEIDALRGLLPSAKMVAVRGPKALPASADVPVCSDLEEVYRCIAMG